ncbi:hypothetical protein QFZ70_000019 [Arthrobacter sp. V1I9]|nr:hypothetical protein [Arthrobacter sp. V1I9]
MSAAGYRERDDGTESAVVDPSLGSVRLQLTVWELQI